MYDSGGLVVVRVRHCCNGQTTLFLSRLLGIGPRERECEQCKNWRSYSTSMLTN